MSCVQKKPPKASNSPGQAAKNQRKKKPKTAFGNFFSKLKKDISKGVTELQLGVQVRHFCDYIHLVVSWRLLTPHCHDLCICEEDD